MATQIKAQTYDVGGVKLARPFKVRRLGHFGLHLDHLAEGVRFYTDLLGFRVSDTMDFRHGGRNPEIYDGVDDTRAFFLRFGGDHHAFVLGGKQAADARRGFKGDDSTGQMSYQVGSLGEVGNAVPWLTEQGQKIRTTGRDMPGSNWHVYFTDPDRRTIELFYGMEQIGWNGRTKPKPMYDRRFHEAPPLPQMSEFDEVEQALGKGVDIDAGYRHVELPARFDVEGVLLPRPFKIVNLGPLHLFVRDMAAAESFYRDVMGFTLTEEVIWQGERCLFFRVNTEHHTVGLYPIALRSALGISSQTTCLSFGVQLGSYCQLREAVNFLKAEGCQIRELPAELAPGVDYTAYVSDPDGHAVQLYFQMDQIGWDGKARPAELRSRLPLQQWPNEVDGQPDSYTGQVFLGPLG